MCLSCCSIFVIKKNFFLIKINYFLKTKKKKNHISPIVGRLDFLPKEPWSLKHALKGFKLNNRNQIYCWLTREKKRKKLYIWWKFLFFIWMIAKSKINDKNTFSMLKKSNVNVKIVAVWKVTPSVNGLSCFFTMCHQCPRLK